MMTRMVFPPGFRCRFDPDAWIEITIGRRASHPVYLCVKAVFHSLPAEKAADVEKSRGSRGTTPATSLPSIVGSCAPSTADRRRSRDNSIRARDTTLNVQGDVFAAIDLGHAN